MATSALARRVLLGIGIVALVVLAGCSGKKSVYPVRGEVVDNEGNPAQGVLVVFHPTEAADGAKPIKPVGRVDEKGVFRLTTYVEGDGAPPGEYAVMLVWPAPRKGPFGAEGADMLDSAYARPDAPKVRFTVVAQGDNQVPRIPLPLARPTD